MNPKPMSSIIRSTTAGGRSIFAPSASRMSALPDRDVTERLPCLATGTPAPATTKEAVVLMLNVLIRSPPVPHMSTSVPDVCGCICWQNSRMTLANEVMLDTDSPFMRSAVRKLPICACVALPDMIVRIASADSASVSSWRSTSFWMYSFMCCHRYDSRRIHRRTGSWP